MPLCSPGRCAGALLMATLLSAIGGPTSAHPHMWIMTQTTFLFDKGAFAGVQHRWTFDEYYTAMAIEGLDKNHDGIYDREELAELAKVNVDGLKEYHYFTYAMLAGKEVKLGEARDYWLEHKDGALALTFTVPFLEPIAANVADFKLLVEDPTFYIAFELAKSDPVRLGAGAPKSCAMRASDVDEESQDAHRLAAVFSELGPSYGFRKLMALDCPGP